MSVLSASTQKQVEDQLVEDKLIERERLDDLRKKSEQTTTPLFALLVSDGGVNPEDLTRVTANISIIPCFFYFF